MLFDWINDQDKKIEDREKRTYYIKVSGIDSGFALGGFYIAVAIVAVFFWGNPNLLESLIKFLNK